MNAFLQYQLRNLWEMRLNNLPITVVIISNPEERISFVDYDEQIVDYSDVLRLSCVSVRLKVIRSNNAKDSEYIVPNLFIK
jgi:hypothetical protein